MAEEPQDAQLEISHQPQANKLQLVPHLPYEIRYRIYEKMLNEYRKVWESLPYRHLKHRNLGIVDICDIANDIWHVRASIFAWYDLVTPAFRNRAQWYHCHQMEPYERVRRDVKMKAHPDTLKDFNRYYWDTRVLELTCLWSSPSRPSYKNCPKYWHKSLKSNSHWNRYANHLSLEFSSTLNYQLYNLDNVGWGGNWDNSKYQKPNPTIPDKCFTDLCDHISMNFISLKTLYLWLNLTPIDIKIILSTLSDQTHPLVALIRKIPVNKGGKFIVRLLVNARTRNTMSRDELNGGQPSSFNDYVMDWEGCEGPVRYGQMCREYEKKFEALMRPDSLGVAEEVSQGMSELEKALEVIKISDTISQELRVVKENFEKHGLM